VLFQEIDSNNDGNLTADELNRGLMDRNVYVSRAVTSQIFYDITTKSRTSDITAEQFSEYIVNIKPLSISNGSTIISQRVIRDKRFAFASLFFIAGFLAWGNAYAWRDGDADVKRWVYRIQSFAALVGGWGFMILLLDTHQEEFEQIERIRLRLKSELARTVGGRFKAGWADDIFNAADSDNSGGLTAAQLFKLFAAYGMLVKAPICKVLVQDADSANDGVISLSEFSTYIENMKPASALEKKRTVMKSVLRSSAFYCLVCLLAGQTIHFARAFGIIDKAKAGTIDTSYALLLCMALLGFGGIMWVMHEIQARQFDDVEDARNSLRNLAIRLYKEQHPGEAADTNLNADKAQTEGSKILFSAVGSAGASLTLAKFAQLLDANEIIMSSPAVQIIFNDIDNMVAGNAGVVTVSEFESYIRSLQDSSDGTKTRWIMGRLVRMPPFWATCAAIFAIFLLIGNTLLWRGAGKEALKHVARVAFTLFWGGSSVGLLLVFKTESDKFWELESAIVALHNTVLHIMGYPVRATTTLDHVQVVGAATGTAVMSAAQRATSLLSAGSAQISSKIRRSMKSVV
jgi:Ca2+-binding EF-hand superfamily protein